MKGRLWTENLLKQCSSILPIKIANITKPSHKPPATMLNFSFSNGETFLEACNRVTGQWYARGGAFALRLTCHRATREPHVEATWGLEGEADISTTMSVTCLFTPHVQNWWTGFYANIYIYIQKRIRHRSHEQRVQALILVFRYHFTFVCFRSCKYKPYIYIYIYIAEEPLHTVKNEIPEFYINVYMATAAPDHVHISFLNQTHSHNN